MRNHRVLVVGATGMLGEPVARRLLADGWRVRCLVRDQARAQRQLGAGFEYVAGDVTRPETLDAAFDGCAVAHLSLRGGDTIESQFEQEVGGARNCAAAAARHGLRRISYLSGSGRTGVELMRHFPVAVKKSVEDALAACGVPWTAFRATHFMESLPQFVRGGRAIVPGRQPHRLHYLAAQDYAERASRALDHEGCANRALHLWGPQAWTMREALERYVAVVHPGTKVGSLPLPLLRALGFVTRKPELKFVAALFAAFEDIGEAGDPFEANRLLGASTTTLDEWLSRRARA